MKLKIISILLIFGVLLISGCNEPSANTPNPTNNEDNSDNTIEEQEEPFEIDEDLFSNIAIQEMHIQGFCYEGMEADGLSCGEADYPFIRVFNAEDFTENGKLLLVTKATEKLYEAIPELYDKTITFVFRDANQQTIDRIYVEQNEWAR
ncbi:hypothetical protein K8R33_00525 [archaeon]|nr:hypothetical protein [archaeon]